LVIIGNRQWQQEELYRRMVSMNDNTTENTEALRLNALANLALLDTLPEERFNRVIRLAKALVNMPYAYITLVDKHRLWAKATPDNLPYESSRSQSICQYTILSKAPTVIENTLLDDDVKHLDYVVNKPNIRCYVGIPLMHNDHIVGALCVLDVKTRTISDESVSLLSDLAAIVEDEFSSAQMKQTSVGLRIQKRAWRDLSAELQSKDQLSALRSTALELVARATPIKSTFYEIISGVEREFPGMLCSILLLDDSGKIVEKGYGPSLPDFYNEAVIGLEVGHGIGSCGSAAASGERVIVSDISTHPYWEDFSGLAELAKLGSCWSEPIISSKGHVLGTFAIYHRQAREPQEVECQLIEQSAQLASIAIERDRANRLIWQQANYDTLTGLPNRELGAVHINVAINNARRNKQKFALMFLDLDRFKEVNDTLGHDAGDVLLIECASRIQGSIRANDSVARLGGDEFVILLMNIDDQLGVEKVANNILEKLTQPFNIGSEVAHISASIGITICPDDGNELEALMKNADQAMYRAKELGRDRFEYFTVNMRAAANERRLLTQDLRQAIANNELVLHYQPILNLDDNTIHFAEALIRWQHPTRGLMFPEDFIALSEDSGIIFSLTQWVLNQAMIQAKQWNDKAEQCFKVSVNTSLLQYSDNGRHNAGWLSLLERNQDFAKYIVLEVSEKLLVEPQPHVIEKINLLRSYGVEFAIDDFGTGYSSLAYIKQFNIDYLKIDKQFIQSLVAGSDGKIVCEAMVAMANKLGTKVVAEGIEQPEQLRALKQMGCEFGQGFHLERPIDAAHFTRRFIKS